MNTVTTDSSGQNRLSLPVRAGVLDRLRSLGMRALYAVLGLAGVCMWLLMQLPISARAKETLVVGMAGCLGLFAMGWGLMRQMTQGRHG